MKLLKMGYSIVIFLSVLLSFSQCKSAKNKVPDNSMQNNTKITLQEKFPVKFGDMYYQKWVAGQQAAGSGVNVYIEVKEQLKDLSLDSIYFRGDVVKLEPKKNGGLYVGRFNTAINHTNDMVMSSDPKEEAGNKPPFNPAALPFMLKANECVIRYNLNASVFYYKIKNLTQKEMVQYPSAPPKKQKLSPNTNCVTYIIAVFLYN